jgi:hypothetical protein
MEQVELILAIRGLSADIQKIRNDFKKGKGGYHTAVRLQQLKRKREELMSKLVKVELVWTHPDPDTLPPFYKRTRAEVREFMGLPSNDEVCKVE